MDMSTSMFRPSASSRALAAELAVRLARVAPEGVRMGAEGTDVVVDGGSGCISGSGATVLLDEEDDRSFAESLETAARAVLSGVQDVIVEEIQRPWPSGRSPCGQSEDPLALPDAQVTGCELRTWFGDADDPVLRLDPIDMREDS